ncbi:MAG: DUF1641 domain-containing protein [Candidatus Hydrothermarchaeaceae archaeon]
MTATNTAEQIDEIYNKLAIIEAFLGDLEPGMEKISKETNANVVALRERFETDETITLLKKTGDSLPIFIELLDTMTAVKGMVDDLAPASEKISKEVMPNVTMLRTSLEKEEVLTLLQKTGDNLDAFNKLLDVLTQLQKSGNLDAMLNFTVGFADTVASVNVEKPKKVGMFGLMSALGNREMQKSLGIMLDLAKKLPKNLKPKK